MVRKGNLLYNGDFEMGSLEGWEHGPYGLPHECDFAITVAQKYKGNYAGQIYSTQSFKQSFIAYNKVCSFEEYEAFLFIIYTYKFYGHFAQPVLYGLDDKGNLVNYYPLAWLTEDEKWVRQMVLLRQFGDITNFKVGYRFRTINPGDYCVIDEAKLFGYKSIKSLILEANMSQTNLDADLVYSFPIAVIGRCKLISYLNVTEINGTSPTMDVEFRISLVDDPEVIYKFSYDTITETGMYVLEKELSEVGQFNVVYDVEGSGRQFTFKHYIRLIPL